MEKEKRNRVEDLQIRNLLSETKLEADPNLKFRVMQQIMTEKLITRKNQKNTFSVKNLMISIFGVMYAIILLLGALIYVFYGKNSLESTNTYIMVILVASVCGVYWLLSVWDEKRRFQKKKKPE